MLAYLTKGFEFFNSFVQCLAVGDEAFLRPSELELIKKKKKSDGAPQCLVECLAWGQRLNLYWGDKDVMVVSELQRCPLMDP